MGRADIAILSNISVGIRLCLHPPALERGSAYDGAAFLDVAERRNVPLNNQRPGALSVSGILSNLRSVESFWAFATLILLIVALLVAIFGLFFASSGDVTDATEVLVLSAIACALQAIYYQRKAEEVAKGS